MAGQLAFIGLGVMGEPMAGHLLSVGNSLVVHTRTKAKASALIARGARWAESPVEAGKDAEVVFVCVTDTPDVEEVVLGERGVIHSLRVGMVVVDHSTISPSVTRRVA